MEKMKEFLKALVTDPKAKELLSGMKESDSMETNAEQYHQIAEALGFSISKEQLLAFLQAKEETHKAYAARAEETVKKALEEAELNAVAGGRDGKVTECQDTFSPGEWCTITDSCSYVIRFYDDPAIPENYLYESEACKDEVLHLEEKFIVTDFGTWWEDVKKSCDANMVDDCGQSVKLGSDW